MRRTGPWLCALALALATAAGAREPLPQGHPPVASTGGIQDVPGGPGVIRGRIVHATDPAAAADLPVVLYSLGAAGAPGLRRAVADGQGDFEFGNLSTAPGTVYLLGTRSREVAFSKRLQFAEGETEQRVELQVSDPSPDASAVVAGETLIRIGRSCTHLRVSESHQLRNPGERVIYVPEAARESSPPISRISLPEGATRFEPGPESLEHRLTQDGSTVAFWGPLYPGAQTLEFSYALPTAEGRLTVRREFPSGAERVRVMTHPGGVTVEGADLLPGEEVAIEGRPLRTLESGAVAPGGALALSLEIPPARVDPGALSFPQSRLWLELDDAALHVDEEYEIEVAGAAALVSDSDAPLLCLTLPPGAQGLRLTQGALGLWADPAGALAIHGPLPAGTSKLALRYHLAVDEPPVVFERSFPRGVSLLSIFVADTGLLAESERLHRRRPVRSGTRTHYHLEGFEIEPEQPVVLRMTPLAQRAGISMLTKTGFVALAAAGAFGLLVAPLRGRGQEALARETAASRAAVQRASVYGAIRDLDEDLETGKISEADHAQFRAELRAQAVALLQEERRGRAAEAPTAGAPPTCPSCRAPTRPDAHFCSQCGSRLPPDTSPGEESQV
jgi:hypothetical protein